jgi:hypothetical protein
MQPRVFNVAEEHIIIGISGQFIQHTAKQPTALVAKSTEAVSRVRWNVRFIKKRPR